MTFPTVMAWVYFIALASDTTTPDQGGNPSLQIAYLASKLIQFSFPVVYLGWCEPSRLRPAWPHFRGLIPSMLFGLLVAFAIFLLYHFLVHDWLLTVGTVESLHSKVVEFNAGTPGKFLIFAGYITIIHSLLEEYYWRWFVFSRLRRQMSWTWSAALSSLAFMAHHVIVLHVYLPGRFLEAVVPFSLCIAAGGAVWAWLYERNGSIYSPWLSHMIVDAAIMTMGYDLLFRQM